MTDSFHILSRRGVALAGLWLTVLFALLSALPAHAQNNYGTEVSAGALLTFDSKGSTIVDPINIVSFIIVPPQVEPEIDFFRHDAQGSETTAVLKGSDFSPSGSLQGPFQPIGETTLTSQGIDPAAPVPVYQTEAYLPGDPFFVRVDYVTGNSDSTVAETIVLDVSVGNGDRDVLRLYETGPDTGVFWAWVPTTAENLAPNNGEITVEPGDDVVAEFKDDRRVPVRATTSTKINPENRVIDAVTGEPLDGVSLSLVEAETGEPASVFGIDRISTLPATVVSGTPVEDSSGTVYDAGAGGFVFPHVPPGRYRLQVDAERPYSFASALSPTQIASLTGRSFRLSGASYGEAFELTAAGPVLADIPLDPQSDLSLSLTTDVATADVGDTVLFTAVLQNLGTTLMPIQLETVLPQGFRLVETSVRLDDQAMTDTVVDPNGRTLAQPLGLLAPGSTRRLSFAATVGPNVEGREALASAIVLDMRGTLLSNRATASVALREDLLRSTSTIIGRVAENACLADEPWVRAIGRGEGVAGVRLYMETGAYVVTDADGLFHFEGVTPGTHVVQIDRQSLPPGLEPVACAENTRFAGKAHSQFVEVQGGGTWRANFYLRRTDGAAGPQEASDETRRPDALVYDTAWLEGQTAEPDWIYPDPSRTPSRPSLDIGIKHPVGARVALSVNARPVSSQSIVARDTDNGRTVMMTRFKGVDILSGENDLRAVITDTDGTELATLSRTIAYAEDVERAFAAPERSRLVADGRTPPTLAIRLEDGAGHAVHSGRPATITVDAPYRLLVDAKNDQFGSARIENITALGADRRQFVGDDGLVRVQLEPTLQTGPVTAQVTLDDGRIVPIDFYIRPEKRDWVVVGLAEGTVGYETVRENMVGLAGAQSLIRDDKDFATDGRVAFFAKGMIKGQWLMTLQVDTDRRRGGRDGDFAFEIDPNAYYTLYGDATYQAFDGTSRYPVYLKLERDTAYALFGDFDTNLAEGRLTLYNRRLSGLKGEYQGEVFQLQAFAAETNQGFAKDELPADGTSGPYRLSSGRVLAQSETIIVETRDRVRADIVLERRALTRFVDYTIDYFTGEIIFKFPVAVSDFGFNPNVIVVDYETSEDAERNVTFGGRAQATLMDGRVRVGGNYIVEDGSSLQAGSLRRLAGVDALVQVTDSTELRLEYAISDDGVTSGVSDAKLAELVHTSDRLSGEAYYREEEAGFGLGQTNSNTNALRRYGVRGNYRLSEFTTQGASRRGVRTLEAAAYREDNLTTGSSREAGEIGVRHQSERLSLLVGLRAARDRIVAGGAAASAQLRRSVLALAQANYSLPRLGLTLIASREQPLSGKDDVSDFPAKTVLGADKTLGERATVNFRHEIVDGGTTAGSNTAVGLTVTPWVGSSASLSSDLVESNSLRRLGATLTLDQQIRLSERWAASAGLRNRRILARKLGVMDTFIQVAPDAAVSPLEINEDFTSAFVGLAYTDDVMVASIRGETRQSATEDSYIATASIARELSETLSVAGASRLTFTEPETGPGSEQIDVRLGFAWRPEDDGFVLLNRFDYAHRSGGTQAARTKLVNNLTSNIRLRENWEMSFNHGIKYVSEEFDFGTQNSLVNLVGLETRYDLTPRLDLGFAGSVLFDDEGGRRYSYGPSIGITPAENVWLSLGYNVEGFEDADFAAAETRREGLFMRLRLKFDENTLRGLLGHISPDAGPREGGVAPTAFE